MENWVTDVSWCVLFRMTMDFCAIRNLVSRSIWMCSCKCQYRVCIWTTHRKITLVWSTNPYIHHVWKNEAIWTACLCETPKSVRWSLRFDDSCNDPSEVLSLTIVAFGFIPLLLDSSSVIHHKTSTMMQTFYVRSMNISVDVYVRTMGDKPPRDHNTDDCHDEHLNGRNWCENSMSSIMRNNSNQDLRSVRLASRCVPWLWFENDIKKAAVRWNATLSSHRCVNHPNSSGRKQLSSDEFLHRCNICKDTDGYIDGIHASTAPSDYHPQTKFKLSYASR